MINLLNIILAWFGYELVESDEPYESDVTSLREDDDYEDVYAAMPNVRLRKIGEE